jgi:hypothetical protein
MPEITFRGNLNTSDAQQVIDYQNGSGIGFFGSDFGFPIAINSVQETTWIVDEDGADGTLQLHNNAYATTGGDGVQGTVEINGGSPVNLSTLANANATLNIRFTNETSVRSSQPKVIIYDRQTTTNHAVDVTTYVYEVRKPHTTSQLQHRAFPTSNVWQVVGETYSSQPQAIALTNSPGPSGLAGEAADMTGSYLTYITGDLALNADDYGKGDSGRFTQHDWYVAMSCSPTQIGQKKQYALYFTVDFL